MERETSSSSTPPEDLVTSMIGKFVAVMSNNDIRYEGVISLLNLQDSKLGLQNGNNSIPNPLQDLLFMIFFFSIVRVYGREVENDNEQRVFQVLKEVHSHMVFRGSDIKSVEVLSLPPPARHNSAIGHVGSLITTEDVRIEGVISHVKFHDSMIFMKNCMCYGTEGRTKRRRSIVACNQLADDIVLNILARISTSYYQTLSLVSKTFRLLILSKELDMERSYLGTRKPCVYVCLQSPTHPFDRRWFGLWIKPYDHQPLTHWTIDIKCTGHWLLPMPSPYSRCLQIVHETVGSETYEIGGQNMTPSTDVWVYDKLIGKQRKAPSMMVARKNAFTCVLDGKLYVMGGCEADESTHWAEVFDPKTQTWEALPDPGVELRYSSVKNIQTKQGKVYVRSNKKNFVYLIKECMWEVAEENLGESTCEIENVCYCYSNKRYWWYDAKCEEWRLVKGNYGGKLVVFWDRAVSRLTATKEIWCAMISLEKGHDGEIWGHIEWLDAVLIAPRSLKLIIQLVLIRTIYIIDIYSFLFSVMFFILYFIYI
ncbi:puatative protein [Arabidopsis thaliana]|nr:puatative protein [Arabidopsis thaliana]CAB78935.1 puatative protein [Arabidopsis thaliana]